MAGESNHNPILLPMKTPDLTQLLLSATLFLAAGAAATAQEAAPTPAPVAPAAEPAAPSPRRAEWIKKFDKNGDGQLDAAEKAEARAAVKQKIRGERADHGKRGKQHKQHQRHAFGPGHKGPQFREGWLLGKFDANNDGRLDQEERAAARAAGEQRARARLEKHLQHLKAVDADGDGKISDTEWAAAKQQREKLREDHAHGEPRGHGHHDGPPAPSESREGSEHKE